MCELAQHDSVPEVGDLDGEALWMDRQRHLHVVQISRDEALVCGPRDDEPVQRQICYGQLLGELSPGARMTVLVLIRGDVGGSAVAYSVGNVRFEPLPGRIVGRLKLWAALRKLHRQHPIDVITTQTVFDEAWLALAFARCSGARVVGQIHYDLFSNHARTQHFGKGWLGRLRWRLGLLGLRYFHAIRTVGRRIAQEIRRRRLNYNVHVLPVAVSHLKVASGTSPIENREARVLFVGRLAAEKNLGEWLRVAAMVARQLPEARFDIVGEGPERNRLIELTRKLGIEGKVSFHGLAPSRELWRYYTRARVLLLTSHYEGFGRVLVEGYAYGLPAVAYSCAGVEDIIVHGETGFLHPQEATAEAAESVVRLLTEPGLSKRMGMAGYERVRSLYDPDKLARAWVELLVATVRQSRNRIWCMSGD